MSVASNLPEVREALRRAADPERAAHSARFFKAIPGGYGEGDLFLGITVPEVRAVARANRALALDQVVELLRSPWHEERLLALVLMVDSFRRGGAESRLRLRELFLANRRYVNNWDLVDVSAPDLLGGEPRVDEATLPALARSGHVWERRLGVMGTFGFIRRGEYAPTLEIARTLLDDPHDLVQKAVGWMLREVGNREPDLLRHFLDRHAGVMPRTMLRYAIEKLPADERKVYMSRRG